MAIKFSSEEFLRAKRFGALGVPLDWEVLEKAQNDQQALTILQDPNIVETTIFDTESGGTGILLSLTVCNDSDQVIRLCAARLEIPYCTQIRWLEDPFRSTPRRFLYSFSDSDFEKFERDAVLNHRFGRRGGMLPGDRLDGFLLGIGAEPIPDKYCNRQLFEARLSIFDGRKNVYPLNLKFLVNRELKRDQQPKTAKEMIAARRVRGRSLLRAA